MPARRMGSALWKNEFHLSKYLQPRRACMGREAGERRPGVAHVNRAAGRPCMGQACAWLTRGPRAEHGLDGPLPGEIFCPITNTKVNSLHFITFHLSN